MSEFVVVIPARFASQRLPGKPLREIGGKPLIRHVYERASESGAGDIVIATDDDRISDCALGFGADVCMTATNHQSGTDRIAEVSETRSWPPEQIIVNLQGDEPHMPAVLIDQCAALLDDPRADMSTLAAPLRNAEDFADPNVVKVVIDDQGFAVYFSRAPIPYARGDNTADLALETAQHHLGIYAYRTSALRRFVASEPSPLEICERLEQLRALSVGMRIKVGLAAQSPGPGIDTEEDLRAAESLLCARDVHG